MISLYYGDVLASLRKDLRDKSILKDSINKNKEKLKKAQEDFVDLQNAQQVF